MAIAKEEYLSSARLNLKEAAQSTKLIAYLKFRNLSQLFHLFPILAKVKRNIMANTLTKKMMHEYNRDGNEAIVMVDSIGNQLSFEFGGKVSLKIYTEGGRKRNIGFIKNDTLHVNREDEHVFLKTNSFGFNYNLLVMTEIFSYVSIVYNGLFYRIPKKSIVDYGRIMNFKKSSDGNSFELQVFLPLEIIKNYKIDIENAVQNRENIPQ